MFRRLCILKGVHPREPTERRFNKSGIPLDKTVYYAKVKKYFFGSSFGLANSINIYLG